MLKLKKKHRLEVSKLQKKGAITEAVISPHVFISSGATIAPHSCWGHRGLRLIFQQSTSLLRAATGTLSATATAPHLFPKPLPLCSGGPTGRGAER